MLAKTLMIQGTGSNAGKSMLVTGLCRLLHRRQLSVAPFKPQNMALNSAVSEDGGEIGRAQAVQAAACGVSPHCDMNPVLLKPTSDSGTQVIVNGHLYKDMHAHDYHQLKPELLSMVLESYGRLCGKYDYVVVEGAGSPAEINLRQGDIANMGFAEAADIPVVLIADIDRGGVFAQIVGTLAVISDSERQRIKGFIINKFRGDMKLLQPGLDWLTLQTGKPVLGVIPYLPDLHLEAEDSISTSIRARKSEDTTTTRFQVVVPLTPSLSNETDFDPLRFHPDVDIHFIGAGHAIPPADLVILPGSKSVVSDLAWLKEQGFDKYIFRHLRFGGKLIGICGGFQMLGQTLHDPHLVESDCLSTPGLGLLDMETTFSKTKRLTQVTGKLFLDDATISGYEIHMGISSGKALENPAAYFSDARDGAVSRDGQILGTYIHGLFDNQEACQALLKWAGLESFQTPDYSFLRESNFDRLADALEEHLKIDLIFDLLKIPGCQAPSISSVV